ncbi:MAG: hypothetical protein CBC00_09095 [Verrucomicrobia bacterium TMED40]|nr:MAG: hypothetical protein CBC00_09095 [Verrucomicrobia bacterium TMED40]|tara:strand:- start:9724 stop:10248 length:525 start_codon:yes stop_codon:yes gene_type:complete
MRPILYLTALALLLTSCTESPEQENLPSGELSEFVEKTQRLVEDMNGSPFETSSPARDFIALEPLKITMGDDGSVYLKDFEIKTEEDFPSKELISELKERKALRNQMIANGSKSVEEASLRLSITFAQNRSPEVRFTYAKVLEACKVAGFVIHSIEEKEVILLDQEHIELLKTD